MDLRDARSNLQEMMRVQSGSAKESRRRRTQNIWTQKAQKTQKAAEPQEYMDTEEAEDAEGAEALTFPHPPMHPHPTPLSLLMYMVADNEVCRRLLSACLRIMNRRRVSARGGFHFLSILMGAYAPTR